ncbi:hypothetical protein Lfee_2507 [Legionella feeleii]|uniref:Uncharacterized protein n=1 Tax=Legionella feeleii TaxID=453 RepID=A0A0W0TH07_9GAMM|nr:hypothetical protein Lfee_2507 [Legionella feeleii]
MLGDSSTSVRDTKTSNQESSIRDTINGSSSPFEESVLGDSATSVRDTKTSNQESSIKDTINGSSSPFEDKKLSANVSAIREISSTKDIKHAELISKQGRPCKTNKYRYSDLSGNSKKIIDEIASLCLIIGGLITPYIEKDILSKNTGVKMGAIKTTVRRLKEKGVIIEYGASKGRNSAWKFVLTSEIMEQYLLDRRRAVNAREPQ